MQAKSHDVPAVPEKNKKLLSQFDDLLSELRKRSQKTAPVPKEAGAAPSAGASPSAPGGSSSLKAAVAVLEKGEQEQACVRVAYNFLQYSM